MESLESKLERLSPEQRKETEDFVDFLLSRSGQASIPPEVYGNPPPVLNMAPPPFTLIEPVSVVETRPVRLPDPACTDERAAPAAGEEPVSPWFQEIGGGIQDRITHDYMDYGQFEKQPSPATEAVKKVRRKIIAREGQEKPRHLLDWVD
jgi:hypothetical protein